MLPMFPIVENYIHVPLNMPAVLLDSTFLFVLIYLGVRYITLPRNVSKIDKNRCKQTLASLSCFLGIQVASAAQYTDIMNLPQNTAYARGSGYVIFTIESPHYYASLKHQYMYMIEKKLTCVPFDSLKSGDFINYRWQSKTLPS